MILEGIVTTLDQNGVLNIAPMGPQVEAGMARFILRPFRTSTTYRNLATHPGGVFRITDDSLLFARSVLGEVINVPIRPAEYVLGRVLISACRYEEFRVISVDHREERAIIVVQSLHSGRLRDFIGFNRARNMVIETAILASRADFLPADVLLNELPRYRTVVTKTGGAEELEAFDLLEGHIRSALDRRGPSRTEANS